jgi:hypothetical protein
MTANPLFQQFKVDLGLSGFVMETIRSEPAILASAPTTQRRQAADQEPRFGQRSTVEWISFWL